jgi:DNA replication protein DnaC
MAGNGKEMNPDDLAKLREVADRKRRESVEQGKAKLEALPFKLGDALTKKMESIPKLSPEEIQRRGLIRDGKERDARRRKLSGLLLQLKRDCGKRLDPFQTATLKNFEQYDPEMKATLVKISEFVANISSNVERGNGLFFIGPPGTGKDHLAVAVAREAVVRLGCSARWLDAATLRSELRDAIKSSKEEKRVVGPYLAAGVLILSDPVAPGSELTSFQADALFRLIDGRYRACLPTFTTSNFESETEAVELLGSQIVDRLSHGGLRLRCQWESYRRR